MFRERILNNEKKNIKVESFFSQESEQEKKEEGKSQMWQRFAVTRHPTNRRVKSFLIAVDVPNIFPTKIGYSHNEK